MFNRGRSCQSPDSHDPLMALHCSYDKDPQSLIWRTSSHTVWPRPTTNPRPPVPCTFHAPGLPASALQNVTLQPLFSLSTMLSSVPPPLGTFPTPMAQMSLSGSLSWPPGWHEAPFAISHTMSLLHSTHHNISSHLSVILWWTPVCPTKLEAPSRQALFFPLNMVSCTYRTVPGTEMRFSNSCWMTEWTGLHKMLPAWKADQATASWVIKLASRGLQKNKVPLPTSP